MGTEILAKMTLSKSPAGQVFQRWHDSSSKGLLANLRFRQQVVGLQAIRLRSHHLEPRPWDELVVWRAPAGKAPAGNAAQVEIKNSTADESDGVLELRDG